MRTAAVDDEPSPVPAAVDEVEGPLSSCSGGGSPEFSRLRARLLCRGGREREGKTHNKHHPVLHIRITVPLRLSLPLGLVDVVDERDIVVIFGQRDPRAQVRRGRRVTGGQEGIAERGVVKVRRGGELLALCRAGWLAGAGTGTGTGRGTGEGTDWGERTGTGTGWDCHFGGWGEVREVGGEKKERKRDLGVATC